MAVELKQKRPQHLQARAVFNQDGKKRSSRQKMISGNFTMSSLSI